MSEENTTPEVGEAGQAPAPEPTAAEPVQQATEPAPTPVDLGIAAGEAAAKQPRSLDELGLDGDTRERVDSYISRQINDAKQNWDQRKEQELQAGQYMTRDEVGRLLNEQADQTKRAAEAKDTFVRNLAKQGIQLGSEAYDKVAAYYTEQSERGVLNSGILGDERGVEMLARMSGAIPELDAPEPGPTTGLPKRHPDGLQHTDGSIQLGAVLSEGQEMPVGMRIEKAMIEAMRDS